MKYEDYHKQMKALKDEEHKVRFRMYALKAAYIKELPFKIGDKVEIKGEGIGWIMSIGMLDYGTLTINYYPPKKNGEKSKRYHSTWGVKLEDVKLL